jgi:hypothetical protein
VPFSHFKIQEKFLEILTIIQIYSGMREYFHSHCEGMMSWLDDQSSSSFAAFTEGWALYSENPVMSDDTDVYSDNPKQKYGMFKWQVRPYIFSFHIRLH